MNPDCQYVQLLQRERVECALMKFPGIQNLKNWKLLKVRFHNDIPPSLITATHSQTQSDM